MYQESISGRVERVGSETVYIETLYYHKRHMTDLAVS